jgi:ankyrin repeat protein
MSSEFFQYPSHKPEEIIPYFQRCLAEGKDVNASNHLGETALHMLAKTPKSEAQMKFLLDHGADINMVTRMGKTPVHTALRKTEFGNVQFLLENGARGDEEFMDLVNQFLFAIINTNNVRFIQQILSLPGFNVNQGRRGTILKYPLNYVIQGGNLEVVRFMVSQPEINVNLPEAPPLIHAILTRNAEIVRALLARPELNVNARLKLGYSIFDAAMNSTQEIFDMLIADPRTDIKQETFNGMNALMFSKARRNFYAYRALKERSLREGGASAEEAAARAAQAVAEVIAKRAAAASAAGSGGADSLAPTGIAPVIWLNTPLRAFVPGSQITAAHAGPGWLGSPEWDAKIEAYDARQAQIAEQERESEEAIAAIRAAEGWGGGARRKKRTRKSKRRGTARRSRSFYRR